LPTQRSSNGNGGRRLIGNPSEAIDDDAASVASVAVTLADLLTPQ
jgi:hypothetical protein